MNDPTIMSINNLREQLNTKEVHTSETKVYENTSYSQLNSVLHNETEDEDDEFDDEDDDSDLDDGDEEEDSLNSSMYSSSRRQQTGNMKKMRKF